MSGPAALGGTPAVPPAGASGSLADLVRPFTQSNSNDEIKEEVDPERLEALDAGCLAPLEVGGAAASEAAPAAAAPAAALPALGEAPGGEWAAEEHAEDAVVPRPAPSPCAPSRAEREAHEATHLPYRCWCPVCVQGRADNPPHRRLPSPAEGERRLPEVHLDYAFLRRADSEAGELAKLIILKTLPSRAMRAWVVPSKGLVDRSSAERVCRGIREMGIRTPCIVKCDGEASVEALREAVMHQLGEGQFPRRRPWGSPRRTGWWRTASSS